MSNSDHIIFSAAELAHHASETLLATLASKRNVRTAAAEALLASEQLLSSELGLSAENMAAAEQRLWAHAAEVEQCHKAAEQLLLEAGVDCDVVAKVTRLLGQGAEQTIASAEFIGAETTASAEDLHSTLSFMAAETRSF